MSNENGTTRRQIFKTGALLTVGAVAAGTIFATPAQAKMAQKTASYQPTPHAGQTCLKCSRFVENKPATDDGTCTIIDGAISPQGWCALFTPKA